MRKLVRKMTSERIYADFKQAAALLDDDNLVWSSDLESIRRDLSRYISDKAILGSANNAHLINLVQTLISDENDLSIGD
jgi:hypothetical protein